MNKKKSTSGPAMKSSIAVNPNIPPFVPQSHHWTRPPMPSIPLMPSMAQLALPPPTTSAMWTPLGPPITAGYGYFGHQMNPRFPNHSMNCCLANPYTQRSVQCQHYDQSCNPWVNNYPITQNQWSIPFQREFDNSSQSNGIVESITEVPNNESNESTAQVSTTNSSNNNNETESQEQINRLKVINDLLKSDLEDTESQLNRTHELFLKMNEKLVVDYIEKYRKNLKNIGDYIREECNRFYQNDAIATKLKPIVEQIKIASNKAKEEKERYSQSIAAMREDLKKDSNRDLESLSFDYNLLPEFPDLLSFYKSILDEIPLVFFSDLSQLQRFSNNFMETKNKLSDTMTTNSLPFKDHIFSDRLPSVSVSNHLFSAPNISDLPKPDFSLFGLKDNSALALKPVEPRTQTFGLKDNNVLPLKPAEPRAQAFDLSFIENSSTNMSFNPMPNSINEEPKQSINIMNGFHSIPMKGESNLSTEESLSDSTAFYSESVTNGPQNDLPAIGEKMSKIGISAVGQKKVHSFPTIEDTLAQKLALNQAQSRLLAKLKEKYCDLPDDVLIDCMAQTKTSLVASGHTKGFSGMKVSDIINKISEYIDRCVIQMNAFAKSRNTRPKPSLKLITNPNAVPIVIHDMNQNQKMEPKGWNRIERKGTKFDESNCSICFELISKSSKYETECHHFFHTLCISNWIRKEGSCPICRSLVLLPGEYPEL